MKLQVAAVALAACLLLAGCAASKPRRDLAPPSAADGDDLDLGQGPAVEPTQGPPTEPAATTTTQSSAPTTSSPPTTTTPPRPPPPPPPPPPKDDGPPWPQPHDITQSVWLNWHKRDLYVLVLDVDDPIVAKAIQEGIRIWEAGLADLAPDLNLTFNVHWAASGVPPGVQPDILFVPQGFMAIKGLYPRCIATAPMLAGWGDMWHTAAHEFGHCLGLSHVFEHGVEYEPEMDIMGAGAPGTPSCPSNLNIAILRMVFTGATGELGLPTSSYRQSTAC